MYKYILQLYPANKKLNLDEKDLIKALELVNKTTNSKRYGRKYSYINNYKIQVESLDEIKFPERVVSSITRALFKIDENYRLKTYNNSLLKAEFVADIDNKKDLNSLTDIEILKAILDIFHGNFKLNKDKTSKFKAKEEIRKIVIEYLNKSLE